MASLQTDAQSCRARRQRSAPEEEEKYNWELAEARVLVGQDQAASSRSVGGRSAEKCCSVPWTVTSSGG